MDLINQPTETALREIWAKSSRTKKRLMIYACERGDLIALRSLVEGESLNSPVLGMPLRAEAVLDTSPATEGDTGLQIDDLFKAAAEGGSLRILKFLQPLASNPITERVVIAALDSGSVESFAFLATLDPTVVKRRCDRFSTVMSRSIKSPNAYEFVEYLLRSGVDPNRGQHPCGGIPIVKAAFSGKLDVVKLFLRYNSNLTTQPLRAAAREGHAAVVQFFLGQGLDPIIKPYDYPGQTLLHQASRKGQFDVIRVLLEHGADVFQPNSEGYTPLYYAEKLLNLDTTSISHADRENIARTVALLKYEQERQS